jgi:glucosamine 6-phosphate synthetase-like amidotransferase/phosphosugar isomerase protein
LGSQKNNLSNKYFNYQGKSMCGIFGVISHGKINSKSLKVLAKHARQRGRDSSGIITHSTKGYQTYRADYDINQLLKKVSIKNTSLCLGHSRLITNGLKDNQPVMRDDVIAIHNGIVVNDEEIWNDLSVERKYQIDSEVIIGIALESFKNK